MTWLVDKLARRIQFMQADQTADDTTGGYTQKYKSLTTVWAGVHNISNNGKYIRNVQAGDEPTHLFTVRRSVPQGVDTEGSGFVKSNNFIFLLSSAKGTVGRLFRIISASNVEEQDEYLEIVTKEMGLLDTGRGVRI